MATDAASVTSTAGTWMRMGVTPTRPMSRPRANPSERMLRARDSGMPWAMRWRGSQFQTPHFAGDVEEKEESEQEKQRAAKDGTDLGTEEIRKRREGAGMCVKTCTARVITVSTATV